MILGLVPDQDKPVFATAARSDDDMRSLLPLELQGWNEPAYASTDFAEGQCQLQDWPHPPDGGAIILQARRLGVPR